MKALVGHWPLDDQFLHPNESLRRPARTDGLAALLASAAGPGAGRAFLPYRAGTLHPVAEDGDIDAPLAKRQI